MSLLTLYLLSIIPGLGHLITFLGIVLTVIPLGIFMVAWLESSTGDISLTGVGKKLKNYIKVGILVSLLGFAIPTKDQLYFIAGGYITTNTEGVAELPANMVEAANSWLKDVAKDIKIKD